LYPGSKQGVKQILHIVFIGEMHLLCSFSPICERVHGPTQTLNHDLNNFVYVVGLCGNKTSRDLTDVFTLGYAAYWEHPSMPVVTESVFC
jgi:hypothetical protein